METFSEVDRFSHFEMPGLFPVCVKEFYGNEDRKVYSHVTNHSGVTSCFKANNGLYIGKPGMGAMIDEGTRTNSGKDNVWCWNSTRQVVETDSNSSGNVSAGEATSCEMYGDIYPVSQMNKPNAGRITNKSFEKEDSVEKIVVSEKISVRPYACTECDKSYGHKRGLRDHIMRTHSDKNDPVVIAKAQGRKDARVKNSAKKRKDPAYVRARKDAQCKARLIKRIKKNSPNWVGQHVL